MKTLLLKVSLSLFLTVTNFVWANYKDEIGYTQLVEEFGEELPDASGIPVAQIEFIRNNTWAPEATGELANVNFTYAPEETGSFSSHAYGVGRLFYGRESMTPGIDKVYAFRNGGWTSHMNLMKNLPPNESLWRVENHSWGGTTGSESVDKQAIARFDYRIYTENIFASVGLDNTTNSMWRLLANSYNSIVVGVASGNHNRGGTNVYTSERMKPDIVAPIQYTSHSTPVVSSVGTLLIARAEADSALADAANAPAVKVLLMAGATKDAFPSWSNSPTRPLDEVYGAGNLNAYQSYKILLAGKQAPGEQQSARCAGWDWNESPAPGAGNYYRFEISDTQDGEFSAVLTWNVEPVRQANYYGDLDWRLYEMDLTNLELRLWTVDESDQPQELVAESLSDIDNVQHIYARNLPAGRYALKVSSEAADVPYALAWRTSPKTDELSPPVVIAGPSAESTPVSGTAAFSVEADGGGSVSYQWEKNDAPITNCERVSGATGPTLVISSVEPDDEATYSVRIMNDHGIAETEPASLEVLPFVPDGLTWERQAGGTAKLREADLLKDIIGSDGGSVSLESVANLSLKGVAIERKDGWLFYHAPEDFEEGDTFTFTATDSQNRDANCIILVSVVEAQPHSSDFPERILALERLEGNDHIALRYTGTPGAAYRIETSIDLATWHLLATVTAESDGTYGYVHENGFQDRQRFYRSVKKE